MSDYDFLLLNKEFLRGISALSDPARVTAVTTPVSVAFSFLAVRAVVVRRRHTACTQTHVCAPARGITSTRTRHRNASGRSGPAPRVRREAPRARAILPPLRLGQRRRVARPWARRHCGARRARRSARGRGAAAAALGPCAAAARVGRHGRRAEHRALTRPSWRAGAARGGWGLPSSAASSPRARASPPRRLAAARPRT